MSKWDARFLGLADTVASWSKDPGTQVGAVITRPDNTVASLGYNGFPRGCNDDSESLLNRDKKIARTIHAELNAILNARESLHGCSCYITHPCCSGCAGALIQAGITEIIFRKPSADFVARWGASLEETYLMLFEGGLYVKEVN